jgi:hypothetical protein
MAQVTTKGWTTWKGDVGIIGSGLALGGVLAGSVVGLRHLNAHIERSTPDAPADYVTLMGAEYNRHFHTMKQFCKTHEEKSFIKTLRHRLSRLVKLFHNQDNRHKDTEFWGRMGEVEIRLQEVYNLIINLQFRIKSRYGDKPTVGFDDAILSIRNMAEDIEHDNSSLRTDV